MLAGPEEALAVLAGETAPLLVGVRHHSPALAAAMPAILGAFGPTLVAIELPEDLGGWLPWLGHEDLLAPVALAATPKEGDGEPLFFYPFADFSPELAAIRWARREGIPVVAIDRAVAAAREKTESSMERPRPPGVDLVSRLSEGGVEELWDTLVEARAVPQEPEALRRAALLFGWVLRAEALLSGRIPANDSAREACMRGHVARAIGRGEKVAAVIGSFHANALLTKPVGEPPPRIDPKPSEPVAESGSLVPYDFELLDSRSGYPAGIRDPSLMQRSYELLAKGERLATGMGEILVAIARRVRERGHVASFTDVREAARLASDLATLRRLPGPGRRELLEAIESAMAQGERLGRGRILAEAMQRVLVGERRGRLPPGAPRSGLGPHTEALLEELRLPGPGAKDASGKGTDMTLDPLRSPLDRRRVVVLARLEVCAIPYVERLDGAVLGVRQDMARLTSRVRLRFSPETAARLDLAGFLGVTLEQAAKGMLRRRQAKRRAEGGESAATWLEDLTLAAGAGLPELLTESLTALHEGFLPRASLPELGAGLSLVTQIDRGGFPGIPRGAEEAGRFELDLTRPLEDILRAALRAIEGLAGSTSDADVVALGELVSTADDLFGAAPLPEDPGERGSTNLPEHPRERGSTNLLEFSHAIDTLARSAGPLLFGGANAARLVQGREEPERFAATFVSWMEAPPGDASSARERSLRIRGALLLAGGVLEADPGFLASVVDALDRFDDAAYLARLPSLRGGFDVLSPAGRQRLLEATGAGSGALDLDLPPAMLLACTHADSLARKKLESLGLLPDAPPTAARPHVVPSAPPPDPAGRLIPLVDRLRLLLGREREKLCSGAAPFGRALDELYGGGVGEGAREQRGGLGPSFPTAREWGAELEALFGERVREEVLGRAAERGYGAAALELDPEKVHASVELLEQVLSLKGGLGERDLARLRKVVRRIVDEFVKELAVRLQPALSGLATPRPTRRPRGPLDLRNTVRRNLATAKRTEDGIALVPKEFVFRSRAKRSLDWRVVLVVDVSGSMEPSVIYSAMMAAILSGLPAVTTHFVAFNDRVLDLSNLVADPLELLLGVKIGGGTHISKALKYARSLLTAPSRSLVVCLTDFEEGGAMADLVAEVRALVETGAKPLGLAALDDRAAPRFHRGNAGAVVAAGMPIAALTPMELAKWVGERIREAP